MSETQNLSEDELTDLGRDLFDEMVSVEAQQIAVLGSQQGVSEGELEADDATLDEDLIAYQQETVPSFAVDDQTVETPRLPEDEALLEAEEHLPEMAWDEMADEWNADTVWGEAESDIEAGEPDDEFMLVEDDQGIYAQETVVHHPDDLTDLDSIDAAEDAELLPESLWDEMSDEPEMPIVDSELDDDWTPAPAIDEEGITVRPEGILPESLWDDMEDMSVLADSDLEESDDFEELPVLDDDWSLTVDESPDEQTALIAQPEQEERTADLDMADDFMPEVELFDIAEPDDPYVAQIALSLTQMSLELAAEATLITNEEEIVALAGHLGQADVEEIRDAIADDWDANTGQARVRFITLPSNSKDYMLYSRKTVGDFTLSMIFAGTTPLRDIRRQGKRLQDALETVPEVMEEVEAEAELADAVAGMDDNEIEIAAIAESVDMGLLQPYTYLWLLRDPEDMFDERRSRVVTTSLGIQLREMGWQIETLQARDEYVYVRADVPGEDPAYEVVDDLKRRVAEIIRAQEPDLPADQDLWADSYLVMMPGRELDPEEISQFISFERML